jgi:ribosomal protein S18 acetylase RimI-like enzyme
VWLESAHLVGDERAPVLFACKGYRRVRSFFRMVVTHDTPPEPATWPAGVEIGPLALAQDGRAAHAAIEEAFSHEWGFRPAPYDEWLETRLEGMDPVLSIVVHDHGEVAAVTLNASKHWGDSGWIGYLGVRPAWRKRGLGRALLLASFREFWERGERTVALAVDVENPTGALRLYESVGMHPLWQADLWQKELR